MRYDGKTPAQIIRDGWMGLIWKTTQGDVGRFQASFMEAKIELAKLKELQQETINPEVFDTMSSYRAEIYIYGFALLPYGRIDVMADILENYLYAPCKRKELIQTTKWLFPVPEQLTELRGEEYKNAFAKWFHENREHLIWNEDEGMYLFKDMG